MNAPLALLRLKKNHERRLRAGHLWVYSNEVDTDSSPLHGFEPGQQALFLAHDDKPLGTGYVNPHSLICARLVSRDPRLVLDRSLLVHRLNIALSLRQRLFSQPYYRLIYGEADSLPGLVVDRYGEVVVAQFTTAGMDRARDDVIESLEKVLKPGAIVLRNDTSARELEGLPSYAEVVAGNLPEELLLVENGARFRAQVLRGQKTGWFFDHRMNRQRMAAYAEGQRVLDVFSYGGAWGVQAALAGAREVWCVDSSQQALEDVAANAALNRQAVRPLHGDAFEMLKQLRAEREKFDLIILDPPAFIKRRKDLASGEQAYHRLNRMAMQLLSKDGILVSASCSMHLPRETLREILRGAGRHLDRHVQIVEQGHQGPDHPVHPAIPETEYLKCFIARVLPA
jgi:23S rRNA (cytosine1962-C5)-methyltransferase